MRILVTYASRHGATEGIAEAIAAVLRDDAGDDLARRVEVLPVDEVEDVGQYDAFVIGSAVYLGRWMKEARGFLHDNVSTLRSRPVWLFSSGPVGEPAEPQQEAADPGELVDLVRARGHRTFSGRLRLADLGLAERASIRTVHAAEGDHRDWQEIHAWAEDVAESLGAPAPG